MRHPWHPLTSLMASEDLPAEGLGAAWEETAARLGVLRLGWWPAGSEGGPPEVPLAFPTERAVIRWRASRRVRDGRRAPAARPGPTRHLRSLDGPEENLELLGSTGGLVAGARRGELPDPRALEEVSTLAAALWIRARERAALDLARRRARGGRRALAAAHDLRNELTRALLLHARGAGDDAAELEGALRAARDLAQEALTSEEAASPVPLERVEARSLLETECAAALEAARLPEGPPPRLRIRAPAGLELLARRGAIHRAVRNVVTNALEAVGRGRRHGTVSAWMERLSGAGDAGLAGFDWALVVEDDGPGMDPERLRRYLESDRDRGPAVGGAAPGSTGLGTASLALALEEGGTPLRVRSRAGEGTRVELLLRGVPDAPVALVVDCDLRRGRRRLAAARARGPAWWLQDEDAAALVGDAASSRGPVGAVPAPAVNAS